MSRPRSPQLESALRAAGRGWAVFPVALRGKKPLIRGWQTDASTDPAQLRSWWSGGWRDANLGAVVPAGVVVVDVDPRHGGDATLEQLDAEHGSLPATLTAVTGSGGLHLWFAHDRVDELRQDDSVLGPGIDTRCAGRGFVVLPPSVHPCGGTYQWAKGARTPAPLPDWAAERLARPPRQLTMTLPAPTPAGGRYGAKALAGELDRLAQSTVGRRNHDLHLAAVRVGQLVAGGHIPVDDAAAGLVAAGRALGLDDDEVEATTRSGLSFGIDHPRGAP